MPPLYEKKEVSVEAKVDRIGLDGDAMPLHGGAQDFKVSLTFPPAMGRGGVDVKASASPIEDYSDSLLSLVQLRREFWVELLSFPAVQDHWLRTLRGVAGGNGRDERNKIFLATGAAETVRRVLKDLNSDVKRLHGLESEDAKLSLRREIARRIVSVPMYPEHALLWAKTVASKSATLREMEKRVADAGPSKSCEELRRELGGSAERVQRRVSEMLRARDAYLVIRDEFFERNAHLVSRFARWRPTSPAHDGEDFTQEATIGLLRAVERAPDKIEFPFYITAAVFMAGEVKNFISKRGQLVRAPSKTQSGLRMMRERHADASGSRFLRAEEVGAHKGIDAQRSEALGRLSSAPISLASQRESQVEDVKRRSEFIDPAASLIAEETQERLRGVIESLPMEDRVIVDHKFGLGGVKAKTFREIGEMLGCSEATAFRRVSAALRKLRSGIPE